MTTRDNFSQKTIDTLAKRVNYQCSNLDCRQPTSGPTIEPTKSVNVGVAAHITAAAPGGPRYDATLSPEQRISIENGIWLCQICAKLIDSDEQNYPVHRLYEWKQLAEQKALHDIETRNMPFASAAHKLLTLPIDTIPPITTLPKGSKIPYRANPLFVGRQNVLLNMAQNLKKGNTVAITGVGGIGKTQLAAEFVHRYGQYFLGGVFWLNFSEPKNISTEVATCGNIGYLNLFSIAQSLPLTEQVELVKRAWQGDTPCLLIFDNCEDEALLNEWQPKTGESRVLLTSRRAMWHTTLNVVAMPLDKLERVDAVGLLCKYNNMLSPNDSALNDIAHELGDLPLALHLAGNYLKLYQRTIKPSAYLQQLQNLDLLKHRSLQFEQADISPTSYQYNVARTFALSYEKLHDENLIDRFALTLLARASYFAPDEPILYNVLLQTMHYYVYVKIKTIFQDETLDYSKNSKPNSPFHAQGIDLTLEIDESFNRLIELGLLSSQSENKFSLHRLLAYFVRNQKYDENAYQAVVETLVTQTKKAHANGLHGQIREMLPHLQFLAEQLISQNSELALLLYERLGVCLGHLGNYPESEMYLNRSLVLSNYWFGNEDDTTMKIKSDLGQLLIKCARYDEAEDYLQQALKLSVQMYGINHNNTGKNYEALADLYNAIAKYSESEVYYQQALKIYQEILDNNIITLGQIYRGLGHAYKGQGKYEKARENYEKALQYQIQVSNQDDVFKAYAHNDLGLLLTELTEYKRAKYHLEIALSIGKNIYGDNNPEVANFIHL